MTQQTASQAASASGELLGKPVYFDSRKDDQGRIVFNFNGNGKTHEVFEADVAGMSPGELTRVVAKALL